MIHPVVKAINLAQAAALQVKQHIYVVQDGLTTYSTMSVDEYQKNPIYPVMAIINPDGLITAQNY